MLSAKRETGIKIKKQIVGDSTKGLSELNHFGTVSKDLLITSGKFGRFFRIDHLSSELIITADDIFLQVGVLTGRIQLRGNHCNLVLLNEDSDTQKVSNRGIGNVIFTKLGFKKAHQASRIEKRHEPDTSDFSMFELGCYAQSVKAASAEFGQSGISTEEPRAALKMPLAQMDLLEPPHHFLHAANNQVVSGLGGAVEIEQSLIWYSAVSRESAM